MSDGIRKGAPDVRRELFGGRGEVQVWNLLGAPAEPFTALLSCELSAGGSVGRHVQQEFAEVVVGLDGKGEATVDGRACALGAGDVVHVPRGAVLAIENQDDAPLRYLIIKARV
ncbi:MAG TPA: cupin domain-containing protein [Polyangiaceae bacterium]|nr:cupin domain-containing protein [Polyangiaceae bacterium]